PAETADRDRGRIRAGRQGGRGDYRECAHRADRRRKNFRHADRSRAAHPHRRNRHRRALIFNRNPPPATRPSGDPSQNPRKDQRNEQQPGHIMGARFFRAATCAALSVLAIAGPATPAFAAPSEINAADTAWMIVATALVLMMTIPGLALFYSGMVRKKN